MNTLQSHTGEQALAHAVLKLLPVIDEHFGGELSFENLAKRSDSFIEATALQLPDLEIRICQSQTIAWLKCKLTIDENYFETSIKLMVMTDNDQLAFRLYRLSDDDLRPYLETVTMSLSLLEQCIQAVRDAEDALDQCRAKIPYALQRTM